VSHSSEFCRHNPLCCFSTSNTKGNWDSVRKVLDTPSYFKALSWQYLTVIEVLRCTKVRMVRKSTRVDPDEDGGSKVLRNIGILPQHYTASQTRRPRLKSSPPCKHPVSLNMASSFSQKSPHMQKAVAGLFRPQLQISIQEIQRCIFNKIPVRHVAILFTYKGYSGYTKTRLSKYIEQVSAAACITTLHSSFSSKNCSEPCNC
jgi:hypothetical protein